jgi:hypothetical protein
VVVTPDAEGSLLLDLPFLVSTWNPYNVVAFSTTVRLTPA